MENLLTAEEKGRIKKEYKFRVLSTFLVLTAIIEMIGFILLIPSYLFALSKERVVQVRKESVEKIGEENEKIFSKLKNIQANVNFLMPEAKIKFSDTFGIFLNHVSDNIKIKSFVLENQGGGQFSAVVRGRASSREALQNYSRVLMGEAGVISVDIPLSNFAQEQNIEFSANVKAKRI